MHNGLKITATNVENPKINFTSKKQENSSTPSSNAKKVALCGLGILGTIGATIFAIRRGKASKEIRIGIEEFKQAGNFLKNGKAFTQAGDAFTGELTKISEAKKILIEELFFKDKEAYENSSSSEKEALQTKRKRYASEVASKGYALAYALRERLKEDAKSLINAQTSGCNQTQSHALQNRNLKALIKTTAANIAIQIMSMETEAALQLLSEPLVEMTAEDVGGQK